MRCPSVPAGLTGAPEVEAPCCVMSFNQRGMDVLGCVLLADVIIFTPSI